MAKEKLTFAQKRKVFNDYIDKVKNSIKDKGAWEDWYETVFDMAWWYANSTRQKTLDTDMEIWKKDLKHGQKKT